MTGNESVEEILFLCFIYLYKFGVKAFGVNHTKAAISMMVFWLAPDHWDSKFRTTFLSLWSFAKCCPHTHHNLCGEPFFILITKLDFQVGKICFLHEVSGWKTLFCCHVWFTNVTEWIRIILTFSSRIGSTHDHLKMTLQSTLSPKNVTIESH